MTIQSSTKEVEQQLVARHEELTSQLSRLQGELGEAALRAAEGDGESLQSMPCIKREIEEVKDGLASVAAAQHALDARKRKEQRVNQVSELNAAAEQLTPLSEAVLKQWERLEKAIIEMGTEWEALSRAVAELNNNARVCAAANRRNDFETMPLYGIRHNIPGLFAGRLISNVTSAQIETDDVSNQSPAEVRDIIGSELSRVALVSREHARAGISKLSA